MAKNGLSYSALLCAAACRSMHAVSAANAAIGACMRLRFEYVSASPLGLDAYMVVGILYTSSIMQIVAQESGLPQ